ncbi:MAG: transcriptional regulator [Umezawaea sp.]
MPSEVSGADVEAFLASHTLSVEQGAIPSLRSAFTSALTKLDQQIELAVTEVRVRPWAGDGVSQEAAEKFNERAFESGDSALGALQSYQQQLVSAMDALDLVEQQYRRMDEDATGLMQQQGGC